MTVETGARGGRHRQRFAAAPEEPAWAVRLTSTLFPQLPAHDMVSFRLAVASGFALIVALGIAGVFPVGLTAAAVLVPLLVLLYLYVADVYENEPLTVVGLTMLWGVLCGVGIGVAIQDISLSVQQHGWEHLGDGDVLLRVVAVPAGAAMLALVGPLVLLAYPRFNDVLDGVIFGAASAVSLQAALMLFAAWPLTQAGLQPEQDTLSWTVRLVELGVIVPVIAAGAVGWAAGACWLAFRAPVQDRRALGVLGVPIAAVPLSAVLLVLAALAQQVLDSVGRALALGALGAIALLLARRAIHAGLLEEADETEPGPDVTCANCGRRTPVHTFCSRCGVALRALPKAHRRRPRGRG
jgi:RsiW-degrading membrane proteinase PrsW (M82 family)